MLIALCIAIRECVKIEGAGESGTAACSVDVERRENHRQSYLSEAIKLLSSLSKSLSAFRSISTLRMEWMTVE